MQRAKLAVLGRKGAVGGGERCVEGVMRVKLPWAMASGVRIATMEEVITTLVIGECFNEELRIERVPLTAGKATSRSESSIYPSLSSASVLSRARCGKAYRIW